jgi:DNA-binding phage protein
MAKFAPFDAADYLDNDETVAEYITAALEDPNPDVFLTAVRDVARRQALSVSSPFMSNLLLAIGRPN